MKKKSKIDKFSSVVILNEDVIKGQKNIFEPYFRILAGIIFVLSIFPIVYVVFSKDRVGFWSAFFPFFMVGLPVGYFALRGNSGFGVSGVYGRIVSSKMIWFAIVFTLLFFIIPSFWYLFISSF
jgi:hypothetical protein